jgi:hypothetical protein
MTNAALILLSILVALLTFVLGALLLDAFRALRRTAVAGGSPCGAHRQLAPVPVRSRSTRR